MTSGIPPSGRSTNSSNSASSSRSFGRVYDSLTPEQKRSREIGLQIIDILRTIGNKVMYPKDPNS